MNLALVLDRSGSMADKGKLDYLKKSASLIVDQLDERDYLSVVEYDDRITVMWPSQPVESKRTIKRLIDGLTPRGATNLSGGMMRGVDEAEDTLRRRELGRDAVTRVLLLSDGLANRGATDPYEIRRLVRDAKRDGVRISTLGLGREFDEDLMQDIAENAGGAYYYIEHPSQMARVFEEELETLFATVIKDARIEFEGTGIVDDARILTYEEASRGKDVDLDLGDFHAKEERTFVLRLDPENDAFDRLGPVRLGEINLTYIDQETGRERHFEQAIEVDVTVDTTRADEAVNKDVVVETALLETEIKQREAVDAFERGDQASADKIMNQLAGSMASLSQEFDDDRLKVKNEAIVVEQKQMVAAAAAPEEKARYLKSNKQRLYQAKSGKRALYNLQVGDKGLEVERLQQALSQAGYYKGAVDGIYSKDVKEAVEAYQVANKLDADGIAGPATMDELGLY